MIRWCAACLAWLILSASLQAQQLSVLANVDGAASRITDRWGGRTELSLGLSQGVPYRVFVLNNPPRLVVDFQEVNFDGLDAGALLPSPGRISAVRFGPFQPGWSRLVADLDGFMLPETVGLRTDEATGRAQLKIALANVDADAFSDHVRDTRSEAVQLDTDAAVTPKVSDDSFIVVLDPGHGGIDPGAVREGVHEADLMLEIGRALRDTLRRYDDVTVVLTRDADTFVPLTGRIAIAQKAGADLFLSLHADTVTEGNAQGATVYTLSETASDAASAQLAAQMDRGDILAGLDLVATEDRVAVALMEIARQETEPRTDLFADALVRHIRASGAPLYQKPRRQAAFSVLRSPDIPSVLLELGFMSDDRDLRNLRDPVWRAMMVEAIADAILDWRADDMVLKSLVRQ